MNSTSPPEADHRPAVYWDEKVSKWVYRASDLGSCIRALTAARSGFPPSPLPKSSNLHLIFEEGHLHEEAVVAGLVASGRIIVDRQRTVELLIPDTNALIRGHLDAVGDAGIINKPVEYPVEVKAMGKDTWAEWNNWYESGNWAAIWAKYPRYSYQYSVYWFGLDAIIGDYLVKNRNDGRIIHMEMTEAPVSLEDIIHRVQMVEEYAENDYLPDCPAKRDYPCAYWQLEVKDEPRLIDAGVNDERLSELAGKYVAARAKKDAVEVELAEIKEAIVAIMGDGTWKNDSLKVQVRTDSGQERLDTKKVRKWLSDEGMLGDYLYITKPSTTLTITEGKE